MFQYLILAVVIVILVSLIYWIFIHNSDSAKRKKSERLLHDSAGTFDKNARDALDELARIREPTPDDYFRRGNIIHYNILGGNLRRRAPEHRAAVGRVVRDYTDALIGMRGLDVAEIGAERELDPEFMVYRMENLRDQLYGFDAGDDFTHLIMGFGNIVNIHAPVIRQEIIEDRRQKALAAANTRIEAIDIAFDDAQRYTNDAQNVHDSKVNSDLIETLNKLKSTAPINTNPAEIIDEIRQYIHGEYAVGDNVHKIENAERILNRMEEGGLVLPFNDREDRILAYTWTRCYHPNNHAVRNLMREAIVNSLADAVENGSEVCPNGRVGRVLGSLVTLDYDNSVGNAITYEAYKNQIFQETKEIINRELDSASNDPSLKDVVDMYNGVDIVVDPGAETKFKNRLKAEIDSGLDKYAGKLNDTEIENIRQECYVYALLQ